MFSLTSRQPQRVLYYDLILHSRDNGSLISPRLFGAMLRMFYRIFFWGGLFIVAVEVPKCVMVKAGCGFDYQLGNKIFNFIFLALVARMEMKCNAYRARWQVGNGSALMGMEYLNQVPRLYPPSQLCAEHIVKLNQTKKINNYCFQRYTRHTVFSQSILKNNYF